jgi:hypothetical protein
LSTYQGYKLGLCLDIHLKNIRLASTNGGFHSIIFKNVNHLKYFETANETNHKIHDFILKFYNTKFYFVLLVVYRMK